MAETKSDETRKDWSTVQENQQDVTERLRIRGGWLYRTTFKASGNVAMVFVPELSPEE